VLFLVTGKKHINLQAALIICETGYFIMTFQQEFQSWRSPPSIEISTPPAPGSPAPSTALLSFPYTAHKPVIVTFLRHCGCPFSEKTFRDLRTSASSSPDIVHIAVSHSNRQHTDKWLSEVGGAGDVTVLIDDERTTYARWGLGPSSLTLQRAGAGGRPLGHTP
jgi:hypothetical protein